tara:strand:- start:606 stop:1874 length:1269 start_codon:yes stop_codon:yes gene_type:complete
MKILVIGSGGREHAIALKIAESEKAEKIYAIPGNPGMAEIAECHSIDIMDSEAMVVFAKENAIDLVIVGPENPLANGITDVLEDAGIKSFGPKAKAAKFEASKIFTRKFIEKYDLPGAEFKEFTDFERARRYIERKGAPIVVKADGLAAGKGVFVAETIETAVTFAEDCLIGKKFGEASSKIIVEECLAGEEISYLVFTDGKTFKPMVYSQDHKQVHEGDKGPNTGGMGAYSPAPLLKGQENFLKEEVMDRFLKGIAAEGIDYRGVLYIGFIMTSEGPKILEFNCRFGDPEAQVILPRMKTDLVDVCMAVISQELEHQEIIWNEECCATVVLASGGYPEQYQKGMVINGLEDVENVQVIHAGTKKIEDKIVTNGGRVLNIVATGRTLKETMNKIYKEVPKINFEQMYYRKDIAWKELQRGVP